MVVIEMSRMTHAKDDGERESVHSVVKCKLRAHHAPCERPLQMENIASQNK